MNEPLVSVVTPFYNTHEYLQECIESVLAQTHRNWEYVLVNNQSTDGSKEIAEKYASRFPGRIRLVHTETFLSQVQNYNFAFTRISPESKYCKMVQADDWIFPDCVRDMVEAAEAHPTVGMVGAYQLLGQWVGLIGLPYPAPAVTGREIARLYFFKNRYLFGTMTSLIFRADLVRARQPFLEERLWPCEDAHTCFDLLKSSDYGFVHKVLTYTRRDNDSIITPMLTYNLELFSRMAFVVSHGKDFLSEQEFNECFRSTERQYFQFLAKSALGKQRKDPDFWKFHREGMESVGRPLRRWAVGKHIPRAILEKIWNSFWTKWDRLSN